MSKAAAEGERAEARWRAEDRWRRCGEEGELRARERELREVAGNLMKIEIMKKKGSALWFGQMTYRANF